MIQFRDQNVTVFQSQLYRTTSTVLQTNDLVLVVDPTWLPKEVEEIQRYVNEIRKGRPLYLLFTHSDWDHIIGYRAFPDAITIASCGFVNHPEKQTVVEQIKAFDSKNYLTRSYPIEYPTIEIIVEADGQKLQVGETTFTFYLTYGHTPCGIFTIVEPLGVFLAGDYLSDVEFPYIYQGSKEYETTMEKVAPILNQHAVRILVPGHGQFTTSINEIEKRTHDAKVYIEQLRTLLKQSNQAAIDDMLQRYEFPQGMKLFHGDNQRLMKQELELEQSKL